MERAGPSGFSKAARHAAGPFCRLGLALDHLPGRGPGRPFGFAPDIRVTAPPELVTTDVGAIASGGGTFGIRTIPPHSRPTKHDRVREAPIAPAWHGRSRQRGRFACN